MARKRKKQKSEARQEYERELRRVRRAIKEIEAEGFKIDPRMIPKERKRVSPKAIEELKDITRKKLRASDKEKYHKYYKKKSESRSRRARHRKMWEKRFPDDPNKIDPENIIVYNGKLVDKTTGEILGDAPKPRKPEPDDFIPPDPTDGYRPTDNYDFDRNGTRPPADTSIIDEILNKIDNLPDYKDYYDYSKRTGRRNYRYEYTDEKEILRRAVENMRDEDEEGCATYLEENREKLYELFDSVEYLKYLEEVTRVYTEASRILRRGYSALSLDELADLHDMGEGM